MQTTNVKLFQDDIRATLNMNAYYSEDSKFEREHHVSHLRKCRKITWKDIKKAKLSINIRTFMKQRKLMKENKEINKEIMETITKALRKHNIEKV